MTYGYARCSTNETKQDINRQVRELKSAGADTLFLEYEHGDSKVKSQQEAMFAQAQAGDTILTLEVPRLARSTQQLCEIIERVREKRLRLVISPRLFQSHFVHKSGDRCFLGKLARLAAALTCQKLIRSVLAAADDDRLTDADGLDTADKAA